MVFMTGGIKGIGKTLRDKFFLLKDLFKYLMVFAISTNGKSRPHQPFLSHIK